MFFLTETFVQRSHQPTQAPIILVRLQSHMGARVYGIHTPTLTELGSMGLSNKLIIYNGVAHVGDTSLFGGRNILLDTGARVLQIGSLSESLAPDQDILGNFHANELTDLSVTLNNGDRYFSQLLGRESFLNQTLSIRFGYADLPYADQLMIFTGRITDETLTTTTLEIAAQNDAQ